jgi:hypothetical protein
MKMERAAAPQFEEKAFFEYHIYDLQRRTTIKDKQTKQISLLDEVDPMSRLVLDFFKLHYVPVCSLTGSQAA